MTIETQTPYILITAAVPEESAGILSRMTSVRRSDTGDRRVFEGRIGNAWIRLMETGPGLVNTAQAVTAAIEAKRPALVLMTGCAGAFGKSGMDVGDIGIATEENDAHLGIEPEREALAPEPLPFSLAEFDGVTVTNRIPLDKNRAANAMEILRGDSFPDRGNIFKGAFVTVATITATDRGADRLYERFRPCMENMEGVAAAHICHHYRIPFLEIRCASNIVGKRDREAWNLPLACRRSAEAAVRIVEAMVANQFH